MSEMDDLLKEEVDVQSLIDKLDFSEENIVPATMVQPGLFLKACKYRVQRMRWKVAASSRFDVVQAKESLKLRSRAKAADKITEAYIKSKVAVTDEVQDAQEKLDRSVVSDEWSKLLLEAYRVRGKALQILSTILGAEARAEEQRGLGQMETDRVRDMKRKVDAKYPRQGRG